MEDVSVLAGILRIADCQVVRSGRLRTITRMGGKVYSERSQGRRGAAVVRRLLAGPGSRSMPP